MSYNNISDQEARGMAVHQRSLPYYAVVHSLLTKRRAVDFCRLHSTLCRMP